MIRFHRWTASAIEVAAALPPEAQKRQVIVFTHD